VRILLGSIHAATLPVRAGSLNRVGTLSRRTQTSTGLARGHRRQSIKNGRSVPEAAGFLFPTFAGPPYPHRAKLLISHFSPSLSTHPGGSESSRLAGRAITPLRPVYARQRADASRSSLSSAVPGSQSSRTRKLYVVPRWCSGQVSPGGTYDAGIVALYRATHLDVRSALACDRFLSDCRRPSSP